MFFAAVLWFSLRPGKILTWVGKILTPMFLVSLALLAVTALVKPMGPVSGIIPEKAYEANSFFQGFLDGYNTMDALASLAFGIVVVNAIKGLGVKEPSAIAGNTITSGILSCVLMGLIYAALAVIGAQSRVLYPISADGGEALYVVATHYFGGVGGIILAVTVTLACLKTAVGLITSCGETFCEMFPKGPKYKFWAIGFCAISFLISTVGLSAIIGWSLPVLMLLYPLAMTIILLALSGKLFSNDRAIYISVTAFTFVAALFDFVKALPLGLPKTKVCAAIISVGDLLPLAKLGLGWVCPAALGLIIGLIIHFAKKIKKGAAKSA